MKNFTLTHTLLLITGFFIVLVVAISLVGGTNDAKAIRALSDQGFSNISITNHGIWLTVFNGCGRDDGSWYSATALNPIGKPVELNICCGGLLYEGCAIRSK